jgi:hypothetical protein
VESKFSWQRRAHIGRAVLLCAAGVTLAPPRSGAQNAVPLKPDASTAINADASAGLPVEEVPYVQTPDHIVRRMLQLAEVTKRDVLWDLGSGDGRIVIAAARDFGARAQGYEIDRVLIDQSRSSARRQRVAARVAFFEKDIFTLAFAEPSVVTMYLLPEFNLKLRPLLLEQMQPGARVVSHEWDMGAWLPDETLVVRNEEKPHGLAREHKVMLWVIPANVSGAWRLLGKTRAGDVAITVECTQSFQRVEATASRGSVRFVQLRGRQFDLAWHNGSERLAFRGEVSRNTWRGEVFVHSGAANTSLSRVGEFVATR